MKKLIAITSVLFLTACQAQIVPEGAPDEEPQDGQAFNECGTNGVKCSCNKLVAVDDTAPSKGGCGCGSKSCRRI